MGTEVARQQLAGRAADRDLQRPWAEHTLAGVEEVGVILVQAVGVGQHGSGSRRFRQTQLTARQPDRFACGGERFIEVSQGIPMELFDGLLPPMVCWDRTPLIRWIPQNPLERRREHKRVNTAL